MTAYRQYMLWSPAILVALLAGCGGTSDPKKEHEIIVGTSAPKTHHETVIVDQKVGGRPTTGWNFKADGTYHNELLAMHGVWPNDADQMQPGHATLLEDKSGHITTSIMPAYEIRKFNLDRLEAPELPDLNVPFALVFDGTVVDTDLKRLAGLRSLAVLDLRLAPISDAGLKALAPLQNLSRLCLPPTITDKGLKELAPLKKLAKLDLGKCQVTAQGLFALAPLKDLTGLRLSGITLTRDHLKVLASLPSLADLDLSETNVPESYLVELAPLQQLTRLDLRWNEVPGAPATALVLRALPKRTRLVVWEGWLSPKRLQELQQLGNPLEIDPTTLTPDMMRHVAPLKDRLTLRIKDKDLNDYLLGQLSANDLLHALVQARGSDGSRPSSAELVTELDLSRASKVTAAGLKTLASFSKLSHLSLKKTACGDVDLKELVRFKNLKSLDLAETPVTDAGLKELCGLSKLTRLSLSQTRITDAGLESLTSLQCLTYLHIYDTKVTANGIGKLRQALPKCEVSLALP